MGKRKKGSYLGSHTVLTQSRSSYEAEMARAAQRAKRRARLDQERHDAESRRQLKSKLNEIAKFAPRPSRPVMRTMTLKELKQKYPEGVPQWMLGHNADEIDRLMQLWRKRLQS
jgi:hypothetical protein